MSLVDVEYAFDGSKIIFFFTAEGRVDFRELVKDLASVFKTRIELRQIGVRDECKMMGGLGMCGRPFCCSQFLNDFSRVTIKSLNYEEATYQELNKTLPKVGAHVETPDGKGTVAEVATLTGKIRVKFTDEEGNLSFNTYDAKDLKFPRPQPQRKENKKKEKEPAPQ